MTCPNCSAPDLSITEWADVHLHTCHRCGYCKGFDPRNLSGSEQLAEIRETIRGQFQTDMPATYMAKWLVNQQDELAKLLNPYNDGGGLESAARHLIRSDDALREIHGMLAGLVDDPAPHKVKGEFAELIQPFADQADFARSTVRMVKKLVGRLGGREQPIKGEDHP